MSSYEERCAALGISRPDSLVNGFKDSGSTAKGKEPGPSQLIGPRVSRPLEGDFSHLNPPQWKKCRNNTVHWWNSLTPEQQKELAMRRGKKNAGSTFKKNPWRVIPGQ